MSEPSKGVTSASEVGFLAAGFAALAGCDRRGDNADVVAIPAVAVSRNLRRVR